jgi:hypothetical protein
LLSRSFLCFVGIAEDLFSNDPISCFIQVLIERGFDLKKFWPESVVDK